ncbi:hypothetical protein [Paraburkholderia hospita]|uniref:hypothetical protein n=1 Tax=Paraburkholderia hospita TaxID=169430 RepID=UPI0002716192|nr:hypothetical protein [Paraburkholderia hospita]EUC15017.1 hypothetical protein PMI06_006193 [Burkholderia sp. BT03]SKC94369.1 hypothetical protein SAMN06266956_6247 [Paraburkholderia hospita]
MKPLQLAVLLSAVGLVAMTTGCATVTGGTTQSVSVKTQKDAVDIAGANCVLTNSEGSYEVTTPGSAKVHRAKGDLAVRCTMPGEPDATTTVQSSTRKGALAGNIALLGVGAVVLGGIDRATGAWWGYPDDITVSFGNQDAPPVADTSTPDVASAPKATANSSASTNPVPTQTN